MSLALGQALAPQYSVAPSWVKLSAVPISPRFPRNGVTAAGPASGITGLAGTIVPQRSVVEAQAWGATCAVWSYTNLAASNGYASPEAFVAEFNAAGIPIQGAANASPVDSVNGPFMQDLAGVNFKDGAVSNRPALNSGLQSPVTARGTTTISFMPANDNRTAALTRISTQVAAGISGLHYDDPRSPAAYGGFRAHIPSAEGHGVHYLQALANLAVKEGWDKRDPMPGPAPIAHQPTENQKRKAALEVLAQITAGTHPQMLDPELGDIIEATLTNYPGDAEVEAAAMAAINAYSSGLLAATT